MARAPFFLLWLALSLSSCAARSPGHLPEGITLVSRDGAPHELTPEVLTARLTVFVFYSESCPILRTHQARLEFWARNYGPRGVQFYLVDSEPRATERLEQSQSPGPVSGVPLLADPGAKLARALGAEFATHTVVVDRQGQRRYSGALDSDRTVLHEYAHFYLRDALDALLAGEAPRTPTTEALGCVLTLR